MEDVVAGAVFSGLVGLLLGTGCLIYAATKQKLGMGFGAFAACTAAGVILGLLGAGPVCGIFVYLIGKENKPIEPAYKD